MLAATTVPSDSLEFYDALFRRRRNGIVLSSKGERGDGIIESVVLQTRGTVLQHLQYSKHSSGETVCEDSKGGDAC